VNSFDRFDIVVFLTPGAIILATIAYLWGVPTIPFGSAVAALAFALFAYAIGQVASSVGGALEFAIVSTRKFRTAQFWDVEQRDRLAVVMRARLARRNTAANLDNASPGPSSKAYAQMYKDLAANGRTRVVDTYYRLFAFYRGLAGAFLVSVISVVAAQLFHPVASMTKSNIPEWGCALPLSLLLISAVAMNMFDRLYYRELVQAFMLLPSVTPEESVARTAPGLAQNP
jgi:hypothetical protein